ncbi:hypothetical protein [uncultured Enterovirga sp.]|uniref:hypothetical protein n=1 Tax=uncultured Enterovirga sp. TaxID=2026352 RepID=UPI0035CB82C7
MEEILLASRLRHDGSVKRREPVDLLALCAEEATRVGAEASGLTGIDIRATRNYSHSSQLPSDSGGFG